MATRVTNVPLTLSRWLSFNTITTVRLVVNHKPFVLPLKNKYSYEIYIMER